MVKFRFQVILSRRKLIEIDQLQKHLDDLDKLCRQITNFRKTIN
jgi:hypothetical protein